MTSLGLASATGRSRPAWARRLGQLAVRDRLVWMALALIWLLGHSFVGIQHDARIYMGRAMADLDPGGVGRDMMFALDGQSAFTVFRLVSRTLVAALGMGPAVGLLTVVNLAAWFAAIVCLVRVLVPGRAALLVLLVALVLPRFYTPWHLISAGESVPIPRPLAEAGVLLALACFHQNRMRLGFSWLLAAALFHPIMAAPGFAVLFVLLVRSDWRWLLVAALALAATAVAAVLGAPVVSRLLVVIDPAWRAILVERTPYLWLRLWPAPTYGMLFVQATTIVIASILVDRQARFILLSVVATGVVGGLAALAFGDGLASLLVVQSQAWRALWLPAALAPVGAGICAWRLPKLGNAGQIAAALLALAWVAMEWMPLGPIAAAAALGCLWLDRRRVVPGRRAVVAVLATCAVLILVVEAVPLSALVDVLTARPAGARLPWTLVWSSGVMMVPLAILAFAWWHVRHAAIRRIGTALVVAALIAIAALGWDSRTTLQASADSGARRPGLQAMLASHPGEVLWLQGDQVWGWLGRPNWTGDTQGAPIVFSRPLAMTWHDRSTAAVTHGLATDRLLAPWKQGLSKERADLARADLAGFCRRLDAPAWIVVPLEAGRPTPSLAGIAVWAPGGVDHSLLTGADGFRWVSVDRFAIIPCSRTIGPT